MNKMKSLRTSGERRHQNVGKTRKRKLRKLSWKLPRSQCPKCKRLFKDEPVSLVTHAFINGEYVEMCPLCYADDHIKTHGVAWNPKGPIARVMYEAALKQHGESR